jgi:hypothetical protein
MILCNIMGEKLHFKDVDCKVLPGVSMEIIVFWDVVLYSLVGRYQLQCSSSDWNSELYWGQSDAQ